MNTNEIKFDDGDAYEQYMGKWSKLVGDVFIQWLSPSSNLKWLDVGCGNGAFTENIISNCSPCSVDGIDPSKEQIDFARTNLDPTLTKFIQGDAMELPYPDNSFDVAVMPLVIFFVPDPVRGVSEMARVVRPGGIVSAYAWDMMGGGFPYMKLIEEIRSMGIDVPIPPNPDASRLKIMNELWTGSQLASVETKEITVQRTYSSFDEYWSIVLKGPSVRPRLKAMNSNELGILKDRMSKILPVDKSGKITFSARANAVKGIVLN